MFFFSLLESAVPCEANKSNLYCSIVQSLLGFWHLLSSVKKCDANMRLVNKSSEKKLRAAL